MFANLGAMIGASCIDAEARRGEVGIAAAEAKSQDTDLAVTFRSSLKPTVCSSNNSLVYCHNNSFQRASSVARP
jgi:hypothetical protein